MSFEKDLDDLLSFRATPKVAVADTQPTPITVESTVLVAEPLEDTQDIIQVPIITKEEATDTAGYIVETHNTMRLNWRVFAGLGAAALIAGLAAGVNNNATDNGPVTPPKPVTTLGALPTASAAPSEMPTEPSVKDYSIDYITVGPQNKNYKPLGTYAATATQLIATLRGHKYLVTLPQTQVNLVSSAKKLGENVEPNGVDDATNTVKKKVTLDQADIKGSAAIAKGVKAPTIKPLSELQGMLDSHPNYSAAVVCRQLPLLDGCRSKSSWTLSKAEKNKIVYGAQALAILAVQKSCAVIEMDSVKKTEAAAYAAQAIAQDVNPGLIELVYLHPSNVPNYSKPALATIAKKGGETSVKNLAKLFPNPAITTTCVASPITPAKG